MKSKLKLIIILFLLFSTLSIVITYENRAYAETTQIQIGGTIRNFGQGWSILNNNAHMPLNITDIRMDRDKIVIFHNVSATKVITFIATPDETMTSEGYTVGISGGLDYSYIYIYDKNHVGINPNKYINSSGNIWIYGIVSK